MAKQEFPYHFRYGDPGLFLEIYVPTIYEDKLRDVLEKGFDVAHVRSYLKSGRNITEVRDLLAEHSSLKKYDKERVRQLDSVLTGYSIYHGKGAFSAGSGIQRDPVSMVRLLLLPNLRVEYLSLEDARFIARQYLRFWTHRLKDYRKYRKALGRPLGKSDKRLIGHLQKWLEDIALVVNGYVIHSLCREIMWRRTKGLAAKHEDELWVGSFRCLAVNRVVT